MNRVSLWYLDSSELSFVAVARLESLLSPVELVRLAGFRNEGRRREFGIGRGFARELLGQALGCDPKDLAFEYGPHGKPRLIGEDPEGPGYNLSHSEGLIVVALCDRGEVGVDVLRSEQVVRDHILLTRRYFSEAEATWVLDPESGEGRRRFLSLFTQKEAVLKLSGEGLARSLDRVPAFCQTADFQRPRAFLQGLEPGLGSGYISASTSLDVTEWSVLPSGISASILQKDPGIPFHGEGRGP